MSYESGWKAINLEFTDRVPRTEYSVHVYHTEVIKKVTGIDPEKEKEKAMKEFVRKWDYAFLWMTPGGYKFDENKVTKMGHAVYSSDGSDFNQKIICPYKTVEDVYKFDACKEFEERNQKELVDELNQIYHNLRNCWGDITLTMGGIYHTLFSGLIEIFGWEMLLIALGTDHQKFGRVIEGYFHWIKQYYEAWAKTDCEVFMAHDDICWTSGPVTHPEWYRKYIFPYYKKLWEPLLSSGKKLIFTSDGDYTVFFDDIVECGAHMLVMEPCCDMKLFAEKYGKTHGFVGNADCRVLLSGTKEDIYREVKRCMDIGKKYPGFIMAVGNHIPANTPTENVLYYNEVYLHLSKR
ncbi:hypothetical protein J7L87_01270 [bacterium]|nr:hypothetical protein [bacterium]